MKYQNAGITHAHNGIYDDEFMHGLLVKMDGETRGELKNSVEQWRQYQTKP